MKISEAWLNEWVNPLLETKQLAALLTMAGLEVDSIDPVAGSFTGVIVAEVLQTKPHSQADRLTVCEVDTGNNSILQVVCGAKNVRAGLKIAFAQVGAKLSDDFEIKETTLRGELSQGMICSSSELGLTESSEGILELAKDAPLGLDLRDYLTLNDQVLDIDLTPNRADCLSVLGVAREVAAITEQPLKLLTEPQCLPVIDEIKNIQVQADRACPHYCGRIIRGVNATVATPLWLSERLRRSGIRSINPVVDVTNYVMLELGQPMHAFNLHQMQGDVVVRFADSAEELVLLDGQTVVLSREDERDVLVIADAEKALALAGVMGGIASAVDEQTTDIFLESAFFTPKAVVGVARSFGLNSESSQRFERGVDPTLQRLALERATELLLAIVGGSAGPISCFVSPKGLPKSSEIVLNPHRVKQLIGINLPFTSMANKLRALGMQVNDEQNEWKVTVPAHRFDLALEVDLIEEIVRLYGYDKISSEKMVAAVQPGVVNAMELLMAQLTQFFTVRGYHETISYSFVDPRLQELLYPDAPTMNLVNPISSELSSMRVSLWSGLLASMVYNSNRQQATVKLFESGVTFVTTSDHLEERPYFAGLISGEVCETNWLLPKRQLDFYDIKGDLQALFASLQLPVVEFRPVIDHPVLHPGKTAQLCVNGEEIGWCGVLHPSIAEAIDLVDEVLLFELRLDKILLRPAPRYKSISKFPLIRRDLSLLVDNAVIFSDIDGVVRRTVSESSSGNTWLKSVDLFDVYSGETIPEDKKSLAISLVLQDDTRTLVDSEINELIDAIIKNLAEKLAITLRE